MTRTRVFAKLRCSLHDLFLVLLEAALILTVVRMNSEPNESPTAVRALTSRGAFVAGIGIYSLVFLPSVVRSMHGALYGILVADMLTAAWPSAFSHFSDQGFDGTSSFAAGAVACGLAMGSDRVGRVLWAMSVLPLVVVGVGLGHAIIEAFSTFGMPATDLARSITAENVAHLFSISAPCVISLFALCWCLELLKQTWSKHRSVAANSEAGG